MPRSGSAWGFEGHRFITDHAIALLPGEIRPFFEKFRGEIVEHSIDPDLWRTAGWLEEPPRHFLDMDAYGPYPFKDLPQDYEAAVKQHGEAFVRKNGTLPWRVQELYPRLVEAFAQKQAYSRENIKFFSSVLSHYLADAHVPFHSALNYDGQLTQQWGVHSRFETELFARVRPTLVVKPKPVAPITGSPRDFVFAVLRESFPPVRTILDADRAAAAGREFYDDEYFTRFGATAAPILERRVNDAITAVASVITAAWVEAGRPALPLETTTQPRRIRRD